MEADHEGPNRTFLYFLTNPTRRMPSSETEILKPTGGRPVIRKDDEAELPLSKDVRVAEVRSAGSGFSINRLP